MKEYPKIQTIFKRDSNGGIIESEFSCDEFKYLQTNKWIFTEKVDGTNIRIGWDGKQCRIGGRTDNAQISVSLIDKITELLLAEKISTLIDDAEITLYGEGYGAEIQKSGYQYIPDGVDFVLFDVLVGNWWLKREDVEDIAGKLGIKTVPIVGEGTLWDVMSMMRQGVVSTWGDFLAEGLVLRPAVELKDRGGHRIITKIKHRDFK